MRYRIVVSFGETGEIIEWSQSVNKNRRTAQTQFGRNILDRIYLHNPGDKTEMFVTIELEEDT